MQMGQAAPLMNHRAGERRGADVIRLRPDVGRSPDQERAQSTQVLIESAYCQLP
jgi:hypothetical protein